MKKYSKILAVIITVFVLFSVSFSAMAIEVEIDDYNYDDYDYYDDYDQEDYNNYNNEYEITSYDINIIVNEDNTLDITENITADFHVPKHGIFRYIPFVNYIKQDDGSYKKIKSRVRNVKVNESVDTYTESGNYVMQIGDGDITLTGKQSYVISYTFDMGRECNDGFDALYYNLIGTGWDTTISNITFSIEMPNSSFDESKLSFYVGNYGLESSDGVTYSVKDNVISGAVNRSLKPNEALTVTLFLDEGYFVFNLAEYYARLSAMILIPLIALAFVIVLWAKYGKDKKIVDVVEFYPPENMNSAEVALWNKGTATKEDTIGLLLELANEGYLDIVETENTGLFKSKDYHLVKKRNTYKGHDGLKRKFFNGLFKNGSSVYISDLEDKFYTTADDIVKELSEKRNDVFNEKSLWLRFVGWSASVFSAFLSITIFNKTLGGADMLIFCGVGILISIISFILSFFIRKRTDEGHRLKQKINGFKMFLETAEKDRLELLVNEDPKYFYNILPYAYVLGVSDKWIKNFEGMVIEKPDWYYGPDFNTITMLHFMHHAMPMATRAMTSAPASTSTGGGFSSGGGGFSGGGFGGGGGGSW